MKKIIGGIWIFAAILLLFPGIVFAQKASEDPIELELNWGFDGKSGDSDVCVPVTAIITNHGDDFQGQLEIEVPFGENAGSNIAESLTMIGQDMDYNRSKVTVWKRDVTVKAGGTVRENFYLTMPLSDGITIQAWLKEDGETIQSTELSNDFSKNQSLALIGMLGAQESEKEQLDGMQIYVDDGDGGGNVYVAAYALTASDIPENWNGLSQLDMLLVDPKVQLSEKQELSMERWQQEGGTLLTLEEGQTFQETFQNFLNGDQKEAFYNHLIEKWGYMVYSAYGTGQVPVRQRPGVIRYFVLILIYAVSAGPILYILLKKRGKRQYYWLGTAILSVAFLGIVVWMGSATRLTAPVLTVKQLYTQQDHIWGESMQLGVQAPYNNTYQLYLDKSYHLTQENQNGYSSENVNTSIADKVEIYEKEDCYKLTFRRQPVFGSSVFHLSREHRIEPEGEVQVQAVGDDEKIQGTWKNPTDFQIENAVLVFTNRIVFLGDLEAGQEGNFSEKIYSYGNGGLEKVLRKHLNLKKAEFPEYEVTAVLDRVWDTQKEGENGVYLLGTITNPDYSFEMNSGYEVDGITQFYMPVEVKWHNSQGEIFCPNGEALATVESGSGTAETNLLYGEEAVLRYDFKNLGQISSMELFAPEYDDPKYFEFFSGEVAFYRWDSDSYEVINDWKQTFDQEALAPYLSQDGTLLIRYRVADDMDITSKNCTLPYIRLTGKVVNPDA